MHEYLLDLRRDGTNTIPGFFGYFKMNEWNVSGRVFSKGNYVLRMNGEDVY